MEIDLLKTFVAICETRSFTGAARQVGRTQSAVSLQIRRLESSLGRPLFRRIGNGVALTEHGELLVGFARDILGRASEAMAAFGRGDVEGVIVLGLPEDYAPRILNSVLQSFAALYPEATVDLVIGPSRDLVARLADGSVDLAFITDTEGPPGSGSVAFQDQIVWVAPKESDVHLRDPLPVALSDPTRAYGQEMIGALDALNRRYRVAVLSRHMVGLRAAVTSGLAVTVLAGSSVTRGMRRLEPSEGFPELRPLTIRLEKTHQRSSPIVNRLEEHLLAGLATRRTPS
jgi:DNA-binding transcriptional LysR family regulator